MFTLFNKIENIVYYTINEKYLILKDNHLNFIFNNQIVAQNIADDLILTNDKVFYNDLEEFNIYDLKNNSSIYYNAFSILNTKPMSNKIGVIIRNEDEQLFLFDKIKLEKTKLNIEDYNWGLIFCSDEHLFIQDNSSIKSYSIKQNKPIWHFDLTQLGTPQKEPYKVLKIIGVLDKKLWVALNNYTLIALDINTGDLIHRLSEIKDFDYPFGSIIPAPESMKIDHSRNILYALAWEYYWEINPQTGEIQMWNLFDYFQSLKLRNDLILNYVKIGNMIYFAGRNDDCNYESQLAGFNVNTKKIEWQYKFLPNENGSIPQINNLKGNEKMLGALDRNNTLHIFEKTQNESV